MSEFAIEVENLSKRFLLNSITSPYNLLSEQLTGLLFNSASKRAKSDSINEFFALRDVSFKVKQSTVVGIIGSNGSGKSTLLKILSRISEPSTGRAILRGRVNSMIEINVGFHPELNGKDNIYLLGTILGLRRKEIDESFEEIVDFSEIGKFLYTPIKHYSSGMFLRLGFAVAAHLRPEILLIDEVLAVGDAAFQQKCLNRMHHVARQGRTVLFVSHQLEMVRRLCDECLVLNKGVLTFFGKVEEAIAHYMRNIGLSDDASSFQIEEDRDMPLQITKARLVGTSGEHRNIFQFDDDIIFDLEYFVHQSFPNLYIELTLNHNGEPFFRSWDIDCEPEKLRSREAGRYYSRITIPRMLLKPGVYTAGFAIIDKVRGLPVQVLDHILSFEVEHLTIDPSLFSYGQPRGSIAMPLRWSNMCAPDVTELCRRV